MHISINESHSHTHYSFFYLDKSAAAEQVFIAVEELHVHFNFCIPLIIVCNKARWHLVRGLNNTKKNLILCTVY